MTLMAVIDDSKRYKISNTIIIVGFLISVFLNISSILSGSDIKVIAGTYLKGFPAAFGISYVVYIFRGIGAGDVKLLAVAGLFIGFGDVVELLILSLITGVVIGICENMFKFNGGIKGVMHKFHYSYAIMAGLVLMMLKNLANLQTGGVI